MVCDSKYLRKSVYPVPFFIDIWYVCVCICVYTVDEHGLFLDMKV
jgi:hypothetical protein